MLKAIRRKIELSWEKNSGELSAFVSGRTASILRNAATGTYINRIPVFVFHSVEPVCFENQLEYLSSNGYSTLDANTLLEILKGNIKKQEKCVALTFDDATGSFWATAFPLLKKYNAQGILFVISGLVPFDDQYYPSLDDFWQGKCSIQEIKKREQIQPLCTWPELATMHESGIVDIQSHSLTHSRINISPKVVDYIHPLFDTYFYENINIPVSRNENTNCPLREIQLGMPVYKSASRLSGFRRFFESLPIQEEMIAYVKNNGKESFFKKPGWRKKLEKKYSALVDSLGLQIEYESQKAIIEAVKYELEKSKQIIENKLSGKTVGHFCYPWFHGSGLSDKIAGECGYNSVFYGCRGRLSESKNSSTLPKKIFRISEEYIFCLPGIGRRSILSVILKKILNNRQRIFFKK